MQHFFNSSALCAVDNDGNLFLPSFVRATLSRRSDAAAVVIGRHEADPCLTGYDRGHSRTLHTEHERRRVAEGDGEAHRERARRIFGSTEEANYSGEGRMMLSPMMRRLGKIEGLAFFVGAGGTFEIWNPELAMKSGGDALRELALWRLEEFLPPAH